MGAYEYLQHLLWLHLEQLRQKQYSVQLAEWQHVLDLINDLLDMRFNDLEEILLQRIIVQDQHEIAVNLSGAGDVVY